MGTKFASQNYFEGVGFDYAIIMSYKSRIFTQAMFSNILRTKMAFENHFEGVDFVFFTCIMISN